MLRNDRPHRFRPEMVICCGPEFVGIVFGSTDVITGAGVGVGNGPHQFPVQTKSMSPMVMWSGGVHGSVFTGMYPPPALSSLAAAHRAVRSESVAQRCPGSV